MMKKLFAVLLAFVAATAAFAAVDVNQATLADLEQVKGIGPSVAGKILSERKKAPFKNWEDMIDRVKGVGIGNASKFSDGGLTVNGATFTRPAAVPVKKAKADKPEKAAKPDNKDAKDAKK